MLVDITRTTPNSQFCKRLAAQNTYTGAPPSKTSPPSGGRELPVPLRGPELLRGPRVGGGASPGYLQGPLQGGGRVRAGACGG